MSWITNKNTIIFDPIFNNELDIKLMFNYKIVIFSDFKLNKK